MIDIIGSRLAHIGHGVVASRTGDTLGVRLATLFAGVEQVIRDWSPDEAAIEETFVNQNPASTLKLGQARGAVMLAPALARLPIAEYTPNHIKKAVVGVGHAEKAQVHAMVARLLPGALSAGPDAADALATAIAHAHGRQSAQALFSADLR